MNIAVVYSTRTGHSKKIADAIGDELGRKAMDVTNAPKFENVDLLFIVSGIYGKASNQDLIDFAESLTSDQVKKVAFVTSCLSKIHKPEKVQEILRRKHIEVIKDDFVCRGGMLVFYVGHPNKSDIADAVAYVHSVIDKESK